VTGQNEQVPNLLPPETPRRRRSDARAQSWEALAGPTALIIALATMAAFVLQHALRG